MGTVHPGHGNVVEPVSSNGTPDAVQFFALSLIMTLRNISPMPSPSLCLRAGSPLDRSQSMPLEIDEKRRLRLFLAI